MKTPDTSTHSADHSPHPGHRQTLVLSGAATWNRVTAASLLQPAQCPSVCWIGGDGSGQFESLEFIKAKKILGRELDGLVLDCNQSFDPDALGAAAGALRGGGLLLLLIPPLENWPAQAQPLIGGAMGGRFIRRLTDLLQETDTVCVLRENDPIPALAPTRTNTRVAASECIGTEQTQAVLALERVALGHRRRPLVLVADRGRGKSAALGIAAARLMRQGKRHILLTGPRLDAVRAALEHAARLLPEAQRGHGHLRLGTALFEFVPPDALIQAHRQADLLLVDEAAAIPPALLETLLRRYARIAFASTVHGYEGTGRGFAVRFRKTLDRLSPQWRDMRIETPIRWQTGDPLEALTFKALLMDAEPAGEAELGQALTPEYCFQQLNRDTLARDETGLRELFGLLVLAHYRTRPRDLWRLLDAPGIRLYTLTQGGHVAATLMTVDEGGFDADLATQVFLGKRRIRGHLLPQSLSQHLGLELACALKYRRVIRIAVHPLQQRRGLGTCLLRELAREAGKDGLDLLGASFGADTSLLRFWTRNEFTPVRLGVSRETSSGAHSASVLQALSSRGEQLLETAQHRFAMQLPAMLDDALRGLEPDLVCALMQTLPATPPQHLDPLDWTDLVAVAFGRRDYEISPNPVRRMARHALVCKQTPPLLSRDQQFLLVTRVLQHRGWKECADLLGLQGRTSAQKMLREALRVLIRDQGGDKVEGMITRYGS